MTMNIQPEVQEAEIPTPEYQPPELNSEEEISEDEDSVPIQSHANIDLVTFDSLNSHTIQKLIKERVRLEFGNMRQRHTLLEQVSEEVHSIPRSSHTAELPRMHN